MAEQLNILSSGQVVATALHTEVQRSYLEYAMSVIVGRALPDVRDGLKPVHRRILYAMHELGLTPDRPYRKCARVVGDVLGKYHPHGDQAVYDALVRLVQDFSSRYPLLAGHGNFGSVDNDPPAAMRYTETRLAPISNEAMLAEIGEATVDFTDNFDNSQQEPIVLPAQLPILLLNGSSGIAVGMATNIPPHNLGELVDGLIALIDRPTLSDEKLFELIPGPDFPTGGEIVSTEGIRDAYLTGRGSIPVRGIAQFEEVQVGRGRHRRNAIVITELPFQVNKAGWIEKVADLVNQNRIEGIADIRDESDRDGMRVVIELKREAQPDLVLNTLYKLTPLQNNFGAILLALDQGQPRQMPLREMLQHFLDFREETLTRQYRHELEQTERRIHLLAGLLTALENVDRLIDILRQAPDGTTAKVNLQDEFDFSARQADAILAMPMRRLTGLERQNLQNEHDELNQRVQELHNLLDNRHELLKALKKELRSLKKRFGDPRRTRIQSEAERAEETERLAEIVAEETEEEVVLEFTHRGYVQRRSPRSFKRQQAKDDTPLRQLEEADDHVTQVETASTTQELLTITQSGKAFTIAIADIPVTSRQSRGTPLISLLPPAVHGEEPESLVMQMVLPTESERLEELDLVLLTQRGKVKRLPLSDFTNLTGRGLTAIKLKEPDQLMYAVPVASEDQQIVVATSLGRVLRFPVDDEMIPLMGRTAQGQSIMRLRKQEEIIGCIAAAEMESLLFVTAKGYAKKVPVSLLKLATPDGRIGMPIFQFALKTDSLAGLSIAQPDTEVSLMTDCDRTAHIRIDRVPFFGKDGPGERLISPGRGEQITAVFAPIVDLEL